MLPKETPKRGIWVKRCALDCIERRKILRVADTVAVVSVVQWTAVLVAPLPIDGKGAMGAAVTLAPRVRVTEVTALLNRYRKRLVGSSGSFAS